MLPSLKTLTPNKNNKLAKKLNKIFLVVVCSFFVPALAAVTIPDSANFLNQTSPASNLALDNIQLAQGAKRHLICEARGPQQNLRINVELSAMTGSVGNYNSSNQMYAYHGQTFDCSLPPNIPSSTLDSSCTISNLMLAGFGAGVAAQVVAGTFASLDAGIGNDGGNVVVADCRRPSQTICNRYDQIFSGGECMPCDTGQNRNGNACEDTAASCNPKNQILSGTSCVNCGAGMGYASNACVACTNMERRVAGGSGGFVCEACGADMESTADRTSCIVTQAFCNNNNQIRNSSNVCVSCAANQARNVNVCETTISSCNSQNQIFSGGSCQSCTANQERNNNECIPTQTFCNNNNQIRNASNACESCPANQIRNVNVCMACSATQIPNGDQSACQACPTGQGANAAGTACEVNQAGCNANNQIFSGGSCMSCSAGLTPVSNVCTATMTSCNNNNQIFSGGSCQSCAANQIRNNNVCETTMASCNNNNQIFMNGSCQSCQANQIRNNNVCETTMASCNNNNQIFVNGSCQSCPSQTPLRVGNECRVSQASCNANNQIFANGICQPCPDAHNRIVNECIPTATFCHRTNQILRNNACEPCPANQIRNGNSCMTCPAGQTPNGGQTTCISTEQSCNANEQIFVGGSCVSCTGNTPMRVGNACQACPAGLPTHSSGSGCVVTQAFCHSNKQIFVGGRCQSCPNGEVRDGNVCVTNISFCNNEGKIFADGACQFCPAGEGPVGNVCQPTLATCNANEEIFVGGRCVSCGSGIRNGNICEAAPPQKEERSFGYGEIGLVSAAGILLVHSFVAVPPLYSYGFRPTYTYSQDDAGFHYNVGGVLDYRTDNFHIRWLANSSDSFSYATQMEYDGGLWGASFVERIEGEGVDYTFSIFGDIDFGGIALLPSYRVHSKYEGKGLDSETTNTLGLRGEWHYSGWKVQPSTGLQWRRLDEFGDNAKFDLMAEWVF